MKKLFASVAIIASLTVPFLAFATPVDNAPFKLDNNSLSGGSTDIVTLMSAVINWIFTFILILSVIMVLIAAFYYLTSAGNSEKITKANKMLIYALVGLAVAFLAKGFIFVVKELVAPNANINNKPFTN